MTWPGNYVEGSPRPPRSRTVLRIDWNPHSPWWHQVDIKLPLGLWQALPKRFQHARGCLRGWTR